jgi:tetratricopeptide (TPR) repeat protein
VGLFRQAAEQFQKAAQDPAYALKGFAQMGLSLKKSGKQEEAVAAFRRALQVPATSSKEQVQILYLLGRTLESLGRIPEALEAYRWLRREAPQYRDVAMRIESLSTRRMHRDNRQGQGDSPWAQQALQMWQGLLARIIHEGSSSNRANRPGEKRS